MRADAADRIGAASSPEPLEPRVSIPRIFALGLVLPFAHLHRVILAGLIPAILVIGFFLTPLGREAIDWMGFVAMLYAYRAVPAPDQMPSPGAVGGAFLVLFVATMLWLCAWQRGAARGFAEPIGRWLLRSLLRFPGYAVALIVWQITPFIVTLPASFVIGWAFMRSMDKAQNGIPNGLGLSASMLTPAQSWVAGIGALTFALAGLWVSARLSPLPALVASQGWRRAFGRAWRASSGHGFGISVSFIGYSLVAFLLIVIGLTIFVMTQPVTIDVTVGQPGIGLLYRSVMIAYAAGALLVLFWYTAIAALLVRESAGLDDPLDPTTFD